MPKFGVHADNFTTATSPKTVISLDPNAAGERGEIVELLLTGAGAAAPADRQHTARAALCTFAGAGTPGSSPTPEKFNQKSAAAAIAAGIEYSAEPTVVGGVFPVHLGFNQRSGLRWAVPQGEGFHINNADTQRGLVWQVLSDAAGAVDAHAHWWEP